jgi:uncharacterized protein (DUF305 family)
MSFRKLSVAAILVALFGVVTASAATAAPRAYNPVDAEFTGMMIPHHYQALVMSDLVPDRSPDAQVVALASRIHVEQGLEITAMRGWQGRNDLPKTDPEAAYEELLKDPEMLEHMGMATPAELDQLAASSGTGFDVMFLTLMIRHHNGAVHMLRHVMLHGSDVELHQQAQDMMTTQRAQIAIMEEILATKTA